MNEFEKRAREYRDVLRMLDLPDLALEIRKPFLAWRRYAIRERAFALMQGVAHAPRIRPSHYVFLGGLTLKAEEYWHEDDAKWRPILKVVFNDV